MTVKAFALALVLAAFVLWPHATLAQTPTPTPTLNPPGDLRIRSTQTTAEEYRAGNTETYTIRWTKPTNAPAAGMSYRLLITNSDGNAFGSWTVFTNTSYPSTTVTLPMPSAKEDRESFTFSVIAKHTSYNDSTAATKTYLLPRIVPPTLFKVTHSDTGGATLDWDPPYNLDVVRNPVLFGEGWGHDLELANSLR